MKSVCKIMRGVGASTSTWGFLDLADLATVDLDKTTVLARSPSLCP